MKPRKKPSLKNRIVSMKLWLYKLEEIVYGSTEGFSNRGIMKDFSTADEKFNTHYGAAIKLGKNLEVNDLRDEYEDLLEIFDILNSTEIFSRRQSLSEDPQRFPSYAGYTLTEDSGYVLNSQVPQI